MDRETGLPEGRQTDMCEERSARDRVGVVIIGRNEGARLDRCLDAVEKLGGSAVYVDSDSSDGSADRAEGRGGEVIRLDPALPLSAARGRNEGARRFLDRSPPPEFIQFVDGDCVLDDAWIDRAVEALDADPKTAVVCGRLREAHPEHSVYNRLCDLEWQGPAGEISACGGNAMFRASAFRESGGFDATVIAGEEPELCLRLRRAGWKIRRIDAEMASHDAALLRFGAWWRRCVRAGRGYAMATALHGGAPDRFRVRENAGILFWSFVLPAAGLGAAWPTLGLSLLVFAVYPLLLLRIAWGRRRRGDRLSHAFLYAFFCILAKGPQFVGQLSYVFGRKPRRSAPAPVEGEAR